MGCTANGSSGDWGGTIASMVLSKSTDGGRTWSPAAVMFTAKLAPDPGFCCFYGSLPKTSERMSDIPVIGIDTSTGAHAGNLYVTYYNWTGTYMQVLVATSSNGGATWTSKAVAPAANTHDQFLTWLTVSRQGLVGVSWMDRRNDPNNVNYEAFAAVSHSGRERLTPQNPVSAPPPQPPHN